MSRAWYRADEVVPAIGSLAPTTRRYQPRNRRHCLGELVQIDGCDHPWFEDRGPRCTLLVSVDDATGRLMELRFVKTESAFDSLVFHFKRKAYLIVPNPTTLDLARRGVRVDVHEAADGDVVIRHDGSCLPYSVLDKRLRAVLQAIQSVQAESGSASERRGG